MDFAASDAVAVLPALILTGAALGSVAAGMLARGSARAVAWAGLAAAGAVVVAALARRGGPVEGFGGAVVLDDLSLFLSTAILAAAALATFVSGDVVRRRELPAGEYYGLVLLAAMGMILLVQSQELITLFLSLEILSLCLYVLTGITRREARSNEAAVKYFVMGAFGTGFLLYGMTILYGVTGSLSIVEIARAGGAGMGMSLGLTLFGVGVCFKVGAVPFHMWVADVYEGAPAAVTAFMSVAVKASVFGAFLRLLLLMKAGYPELTGILIHGAALASMIVGNLMALRQRSVKRMLGYSSVAHTGYVLVGIASLRGADGSPDAAAASVFYLFVYTFMTLGAFAFLVFAGREGREAEALEDYSGLAKRAPWAAAAMAVFMVSLAGIPPTAGFAGKFALFKAAIGAGEVALVVVGLLASAVSAYYYLRVVVYMYMHPGVAAGEGAPAPGAALTVMLAAALTLLFGILPSLNLELSYRSVESFFR